jgi:NAD(P)-dependent dehydrogenase (short-subunit alcohol dehydrogenase family)
LIVKPRTALQKHIVQQNRIISMAAGKVIRFQLIAQNCSQRTLPHLVYKPQPFTEVERETLDLILNLNVRSAFLVAQAAARVMVKQGSGSIINMGSQMGHVGAKNRTVYCMTKHAIEGLTKAMAVELAVLDIRVNSVAPTFIETPLTKPMFENPEFHQDVISRIPMGHIGQVDDVANAVLFLASPAANMVTGDSLKVDGGWTAV